MGEAISLESIQRALKWDMCLTCAKKLTKFRADVLRPDQAMMFLGDRPQMCTDCAREEAASRKGLVIIWISRKKSVPMSTGKVASFQLSPPDAIEWRVDGRAAFRDEAIMGMKTVILPLIQSLPDEAAFDQLGTRLKALMPTLPVRSSANVATCLDCKKQTNEPGVLGCTKVGCALLGEEEAGDAA